MNTAVRVAVTGLGAVTPVGVDEPSTWAALVAGISGLRALSAFDAESFGLAPCAAGQIDSFDVSTYLDKRSARRMHRSSHLALAAAWEALHTAGLLVHERDAPRVEGSKLDTSTVPSDRVGVFIGSGLGGGAGLVDEDRALRESGPRRVSPFTIPMALADSIGGNVAIAFSLRGPNIAHVTACASGANAIGEAFEVIRRGAADVMVTGGSEASLTPAVVAGFRNMGALSSWAGEPRLASRPFDANRDGFVIGEGAAVMVLERMDLALARGARVLAEIAGYGTSADAVHATAPAEDGEGMVRAARQALAQARLVPADVASVSAHGTSTPLNDAVETIVIKEVLGPRAYDVPVNAVKSMVGHLLGAGGALEAVVAARTVASGVIPPTINLETPDPQCDLDYVPSTARAPADGVPVVLSNSLGFGGHNAALVVCRA